MSKDTNPLEPKVLEFKFYARGVGPVLAISVSGGGGREELLSFPRCSPVSAAKRGRAAPGVRGDVTIRSSARPRELLRS